MTRSITLSAVGGLLVVLGLTAMPRSIEARDFGQLGQTFPIIEPDLLSTIESRLQRAKASGELARMNGAFARRVAAKVQRPQPVAGITAAIERREWYFDPTVRIERDIRDQKGNLVASAGQRINPLDFVIIRQDLVFIDGDDVGQLAWAIARYPDAKAKIVFVRGAPLEAMTRRGRRFFFDQDGKLTTRFGIEHTPAVVRQAGRMMRITEEVVTKARAS